MTAAKTTTATAATTARTAHLRVAAAKPERALRARLIAAGRRVQSVGAGGGIAQKRIERIGAVFAIQIGLRLGRGCDDERRQSDIEAWVV